MKKNYSIYTPKKIANLMAEKVLSKYFENGYTKEKIESIKICDLSVGTGNLIIPILEKLIKLSYKIYGEYRFIPTWIRGYDIAEDAVEIAKDRVVELFLRYGVNGEINIFHKNGLEISEKFNIIIGNPPYLGEKNNKEIFQKLKDSEFGRKYYEAKMDYFYFFIEKAIEILEKDGILIYLTTNYWLKADSGSILRKELMNNGKYLEMIYYDNSLFSDAVGQSNIIFMWQKGILEDKNIKIIDGDKNFEIKNSKIYDDKQKIILANEKERVLSEKIRFGSNFLLNDLVNVNQGIITGYDRAFVFDKYRSEFAKYLKPFYKNKDIDNYTYGKNKYWILYLDKNSTIDEKLERHLLGYYEKLSCRREVKNGKISWWQLLWARDENIFKGEKLLVRQRCKENRFAYSDKEFYGSADIYFITKKKQVNLFYILGYLNSEIFLTWFRINGKLKGKNYEFYATPLKETPIYYPEDIEKIEYIASLVKKQIQNYSDEIQAQINSFFFKHYKLRY